MVDRATSQNIRYYDEEAPAYDKSRYESLSGRRLDLFQKTLISESFSALPPGAKVLEYGCGTGRFLPYFSKKGYQLTGVDVSKNMLSLAQERLRTEGIENTQLHLTNGDTLPFENDSFDAVYSILVINLVPEYGKLFKEIARVLKPDGVFVFNVPNLTSIFFPVGLYVNARGRSVTSNAAGGRYSHWFSAPEVKAALAGAGFMVEEVRGQPLTVGQRKNARPLKLPGFRWLLAKSVYIKARLNQ